MTRKKYYFFLFLTGLKSVGLSAFLINIRLLQFYMIFLYFHLSTRVKKFTGTQRCFYALDTCICLHAAAADATVHSTLGRGDLLV